MEQGFEDLSVLTETANSGLAKLIPGDFIGDVCSHKYRNIDIKTSSDLIRNEPKSVFSDVDALNNKL